MTAFEYLQAIRQRTQMTQAQVSERTGIPQPTLSKIERGGPEKDVLSQTYLKLEGLYRELFPAKPSKKARA